MSKMAVDIVLLPDQTMTERAIHINAQLVADAASEIILHRQTCLPHVSLAMGCIEDSEIETVGQMLQTIARDYPTGRLVATGVVTSLNARGQQVSILAIAKTQPLQTLHEHIMDMMRNCLSHDVTPEMVFGQEDVAETTLSWIRTFREKSSFGAFFPHITLGYGPVVEPMTFPVPFEASHLALCHLGNHCTCRKVLTSAPM